MIRMFLARVADLPNFRCHNECHSRVLARDADADADAEYEKLSANGLWRPDLARPDTRRSWLVVRLSGVRFSEAAPRSPMFPGPVGVHDLYRFGLDPRLTPKLDVTTWYQEVRSGTG